MWWKLMFLSIVDFFAVRKNWRETLIGFSLAVSSFILDGNMMYRNLGRVLPKIYWGLTIVSKEIECADRIVDETEFIKLF